MLPATRAKLSEQAGVQYVCADAEQLPFANQTLDYIFSNLALQWCQALAVVFADSKRLLKADGQLVFSTFGTTTLQELKAAWATVDDYHHVNTFYSEAQLRILLQHAGFKDIRGTTTRYVSRYDSVLALMHELKQLGAQSVLAGRNPHTTRKSALQQMIAAYEKHLNDANITATFEVIMLSAKA
jgi:malonyl-CoA O-methyltransferase